MMGEGNAWNKKGSLAPNMLNMRDNKNVWDITVGAIWFNQLTKTLVYCKVCENRNSTFKW